jgi:hypothetical protein
MMIKLDENENITGHFYSEPERWVSTHIIAWLESTSVHSSEGTRLVGRYGETLGYVARPSAEVAAMWARDAARGRKYAEKEKWTNHC